MVLVRGRAKNGRTRAVWTRSWASVCDGAIYARVSVGSSLYMSSSKRSNYNCYSLLTSKFSVIPSRVSYFCLSVSSFCWALDYSVGYSFWNGYL